MYSAKQSLSHHTPSGMPDASRFNFGIAVSEWNREITQSLENAAVDFLKKSGVAEANIKIIKVPGSFELTAGAVLLAEQKVFDAIICLGCVIQGETRHFEFICQAVAQGITGVSIRYHVPVIFGVLTTDTQVQASERAGGKFGNKGEEAAATAIKMAELFDKNSAS
jgi:6,7-dimethyl-8-ribityllumazine synthase